MAKSPEQKIIDQLVKDAKKKAKTDASLVTDATKLGQNNDWLKSQHQIRVERFMQKAGQAIPDVPTMPIQPERILRARLIMEKALELINKGLGIELALKDSEYDTSIRMCNLIFQAVLPPDMIQIADGCADLSVVNIGTMSQCGIADTPLLEEVDDNNLDKFAEGAYRDEHGKWNKPAGHPKPRIVEVLANQGWKE